MDLHSVKTGFFEHRSEPENGLNFRFLLEHCQRLANFLGIILVFEGRVKREACFEESVLFGRYFSVALSSIFKNVLVSFWTSGFKSVRY